MSVELTHRELDYLVAQREELFRPNKFRRIMQIDTSAPSWAERVEIEKITMYGDVRPTVAGGSDKPRSPTMDRASGYLRIFEFEAMYDIRYSDLERVAAMGLGSLDVRKSAANQTRAEQILDQIACVGDNSEAGWPTMPGLANSGDVTPAAASGVWSNASDTSDILNDMHSCVDSVHSGSLEIFTANRLLMSLAKFQFIARKRLGDGTDMTILSAFREQAPGVEVAAWNRLATAGAGSVQRMVAFDASKPESPRMILTRELTDNPPAPTLYGYEIGQTMRTAGVLIEQSSALAYTDGI